jgi:DNA-binding NarL/FixJ family response regulator
MDLPRMKTDHYRSSTTDEVNRTAVIRVLVADQHPVIRIGVENLLQAEAGIEVVGEAGDGDGAIAKTLELCPDILLLALNLPNLPGLEAMRDVVNRSPKTRTILLSNVISQVEVVKALQLGARGIVVKDVLMDNLISGIRAVHTGKCWLRDRRMTNLVDALHMVDQEKAPSVEKRVPGLTPRELEVVSCVVKGCSNRDIAQQFQLSEETVKRHLSNIFEKIGVSTRLELALFAIKHQLVATHS